MFYYYWTNQCRGLQSVPRVTVIQCGLLGQPEKFPKLCPFIKSKLKSNEPLGCYTVSIYVYNQSKWSEVSHLLIFCVLEHRFIPHYLQHFLANQLNQMVLDRRAIKFSSTMPTLVLGSFFKKYFVQKWKWCTIYSPSCYFICLSICLSVCLSVSFLCFEEEEMVWNIKRVSKQF